MAFDRPEGIITIACEASNQDHIVRQGVAASFFNRLRAGRYGKTIASVCRLRYAYSATLPDSADNANLERVMDLADDDPVILDCGIAYDEAAAGADPTDGATHFYADSINPPNWAAKATQTVKLGALLFFKNVP